MTTTLIERPAELYDAPVTAEELQQLEALFEEPAMDWDEGDATEEQGPMFILAGLSFAAALAYAAYCTSKGGSPSISAGWTGFKITCRR